MFVISFWLGSPDDWESFLHYIGCLLEHDVNLPKPSTGEHTCPSCSVDSASSNKTSLDKELVLPAPRATLLVLCLWCEYSLLILRLCRLNLALQVRCHLCKVYKKITQAIVSEDLIWQKLKLNGSGASMETQIISSLWKLWCSTSTGNIKLLCIPICAVAMEPNMPYILNVQQNSQAPKKH